MLGLLLLPGGWLNGWERIGNRVKIHNAVDLANTILKYPFESDLKYAASIFSARKEVNKEMKAFICVLEVSCAAHHLLRCNASRKLIVNKNQIYTGMCGVVSKKALHI